MSLVGEDGCRRLADALDSFSEVLVEIDKELLTQEKGAKSALRTLPSSIDLTAVEEGVDHLTVSIKEYRTVLEVLVCRKQVILIAIVV